jgi:hypothetical protein
VFRISIVGAEEAAVCITRLLETSKNGGRSGARMGF